MSPRSSRWTRQELKRLPAWFKPREHLPNEVLAKQFAKDFSRSRSGGAIRAAAWREKKKSPESRSMRRRKTRTGAPGSAWYAPTTVALKTQRPRRTRSPGTLAEDSEPSHGLFPPTCTRNILTATVQVQPEQLRAERAASDTHDEDQDHGPAFGSDNGFQEIQLGTATRESSSEETLSDDGSQNQPDAGMSYHLHEHGGNGKPAFTPVNFQKDENATLSDPNHSSPLVHLIPIQNVH